MGWARANLLYEKTVGVPLQNSPLESLFILVFVQRQEAELMATRALVEATLADEERKSAVEAFEGYCEKMFPFWERASAMEDDEEKKALAELVKRPIQINMSAVWSAQAKKLKARTRRIPNRLRAKKDHG